MHRDAVLHHGLLDKRVAADLQALLHHPQRFSLQETHRRSNRAMPDHPSNGGLLMGFTICLLRTGIHLECSEYCP